MPLASARAPKVRAALASARAAMVGATPRFRPGFDEGPIEARADARGLPCPRFRLDSDECPIEARAKARFPSKPERKRGAGPARPGTFQQGVPVLRSPRNRSTSARVG